MATKKVVSERQVLIQRFEKRIKAKRKNLVATKKFHRVVESEIERKIRLEVMQLNALKRSK